MKQIFKKNQIMITALAVMIAVAGYYQYQKFGTKDDLSLNASASLELE